MSVMLIPDADLIQVAAYAARHRMLPPQVSAMTFAQGLRESNVALWQEQYEEVLDLSPISTAALEAVVGNGDALDHRRIVRAIPSIHYNCALIEGTLLWAVMAQFARRIGLDVGD